MSKEYGKQFSPILRVPSVYSFWEYNYLLNPDQLDVEIVDTSYYV